MQSSGHHRPAEDMAEAKPADSHNPCAFSHLCGLAASAQVLQIFSLRLGIQFGISRSKINPAEGPQGIRGKSPSRVRKLQNDRSRLKPFEHSPRGRAAGSSEIRCAKFAGRLHRFLSDSATQHGSFQAPCDATRAQHRHVVLGHASWWSPDTRSSELSSCPSAAQAKRSSRCMTSK